MFNWVKKIFGNDQKSDRPDYHEVDSKKAARLFQNGRLEKILLTPLEFGGEDNPQNILYVPVGTAAIKSGIDKKVVAPLMKSGTVSQYDIKPEYQGASIVPIRLRIKASIPSFFATDVNLWGDALIADSTAPVRGATHFQEIENVEDSPPTSSLKSPQQAVTSFIWHVHRWEAAASEHCKFGGSLDRPKQEYKNLIAQFCIPSVEPQPISFGDSPSHHPETETIESTTINGAAAIVQTKFIEQTGLTSYEYHLVNAADGWKINSVFYVDANEKHECL